MGLDVDAIGSGGGGGDAEAILGGVSSTAITSPSVAVMRLLAMVSPATVEGDKGAALDTGLKVIGGKGWVGGLGWGTCNIEGTCMVVEDKRGGSGCGTGGGIGVVGMGLCDGLRI